MTQNEEAYLALMEDLQARGVQAGNFSIGGGWVPMVRELVERLDEVAPERWTPIQVKEKFSGLRFYFTLDLGSLYDEDANALSERVRALVDEVERKSYTTCEWCGADGKGRRTHHGGYVTACDEHAPEGSKVLQADD